MRYLIMILVSMVMIISGCKSQKESVSKKAVGTIDEVNLKQMTLLEMSLDSIRNDPYEVQSFNVIGDSVEITVSFGGGCGSADFVLYYTQRMMHSMPPQTVLHLGFTDSDPCRAIETQKLTYSLEPFRQLAESGGIWLILADSELRQLYERTPR